MESIQHARARYAAAHMRSRFESLSGEKLKGPLKKYRTVVMSSVAEIRAIGLLQLTAFWLSKGDAKLHVFQDLMAWLRDARSTRDFLSKISPEQVRSLDKPKSPAGHQVFDQLTQLDSRILALLEDEAEEYLVWLKRLTEGRWKELGSEEDRDNDKDNEE